MVLKANPLVSIIMPAYNVEKYIVTAVESILNQTYKNLELLICDDGSSDKTWAIIQKFSDPRIKKFKNRKNIGNLKTTNFLFAECKGEFIGIQDADDYCALNKIELQLMAFEGDLKLGMVGTNHIVLNPQGEAYRCGVCPLTYDEITLDAEKGNSPFIYGTVLFKAEILKEIGLFRSFFNRLGGADLDFLYRIIEKYEAINLKEILYFYRYNPESFTKRKSSNLLKLHAEEIAVFLAEQRRNNGGEDALNQNKILQINNFLNQLFIELSTKYLWNNKNRLALQYAHWALKMKRNAPTLRHYFYILRSLPFRK